MSHSTEMLLKLHLETFVPLLIHEFSSGQCCLSFERPDLVDIIAAQGDAILYRVPGKTARAVGALVEAVATLAFCPGGVTLFGTHFEAPLPDYLTSPPDTTPSQALLSLLLPEPDPSAVFRGGPALKTGAGNGPN
jgi:hypothetical protein